MPANRSRDRLAPASANGRIGDARDEWLKEPAGMADAEAVDKSRQTHQCTSWNYAGLRTTEDINLPYHGVWEQIPKRTSRTTVVVRIGDCLPSTCSCLAGIFVRKEVFHSRRRDRMRKSGFTRRSSVRLRARARWHGAVRAGIPPLRIAGNDTGCLSSELRVAFKRDDEARDQPHRDKEHVSPLGGRPE